MRTPQRAQVVIDLINENNFKCIVEVGVCKGEMAMPVLANCDLNYYGMVDPAFNNSLGFYDFIENYLSIVRLFEMTSHEASKYFSSAYNLLDMVIIDALHTEKDVDEDIHLWTPKIRVGGIACGHDYDNKRFPGVKIAVDRYFGTGRVLTKPVRACKMWTVKLISDIEKQHLIK